MIPLHLQYKMITSIALPNIKQTLTLPKQKPEQKVLLYKTNVIHVYQIIHITNQFSLNITI